MRTVGLAPQVAIRATPGAPSFWRSQEPRPKWRGKSDGRSLARGENCASALDGSRRPRLRSRRLLDPDRRDASPWPLPRSASRVQRVPLRRRRLQPRTPPPPSPAGEVLQGLQEEPLRGRQRATQRRVTEHCLPRRRVDTELLLQEWRRVPLVPGGGAGGGLGPRPAEHHEGRAARVRRLWRAGEHATALDGQEAVRRRPAPHSGLPAGPSLRAHPGPLHGDGGAVRAGRARLHRQLGHARRGLGQVSGGLWRGKLRGWCSGPGLPLKRSQVLRHHHGGGLVVRNGHVRARLVGLRAAQPRPRPPPPRAQGHEREGGPGWRPQPHPARRHVLGLSRQCSHTPGPR